MLNKQFLQSFIIIFCITVFSNIIYQQGSNLYRSLYYSFKEKEITSDVVKDVEKLIEEEIFVKESEPIAVFFYQDNYNSRVKFESNSIVSSPIVDDVRTDPEYSRALKYHQASLCYQQRVSDLTKTSSLYTAYIALNQDISFPSYYTSCPIFAKDKLIGYIGTFYNLDVPSKPSIRISRLEYLSYLIGNSLSPYF